MLCVWLALPSALFAAPAKYETHIKPLLARHCVSCHGASVQKGGLRLDTGMAGARGGESGPAWIPGNPRASLIAQVTQGSHPEIPRMPYKRPPLDAKQSELLEAWIASGAAVPAQEVPSSDQHWAFIPPRRPLPAPNPLSLRESVHPIDTLIRPHQQRAGLQPSPEADHTTLLRRVTLDLTGLPPSPEEVDRFLNDSSPFAYERQIEALLASPHYGERWGRWWLDQARYADSNGYSIDSPRDIWPFRDWVVSALNQDMPFDQFSIWQLAGDLLPNRLVDGRPQFTEPWVASGFHRNTQVNHEGGIDKEQFRIESVVDRVNTTATVWLGLTLACAQCHDHKFDPLTQQDYYRFFAYFNSSENDGHGNAELEAEHHLELGSPTLLGAVSERRAEWKAKQKELEHWADASLKPQQSAWENQALADPSTNITSLVKDLIRIPANQRGTDQAALIWRTFRDQNPEYLKRKKAVDAVKSRIPVVPRTLVMVEKPDARETRILIKGDFTRPGDLVEPGPPRVLSSLPTHPSGTGVRPTRLDLARWIVSPTNPLTARVIVNKVWLQYFGRGLVETENDFGLQGTAPSHPELLDWLATEFMESGWSLKTLHRRILTSATYRQSSHTDTDSASFRKDPSNRWFARQTRLRLDAESIRDGQLRAAGLLTAKLGGPPVFPPLPAGLGVFTQNDRPWNTSQGSDRYRRSIYTHLQRTLLHPSLTVFDAADGYQPCTRRLRSNTPLQALTLLNDPAFVEISRAFAAKLLRDFPHEADEERVKRAFRLVSARTPSKPEQTSLIRLVQSERNSASIPGSTSSPHKPALLPSPSLPSIPNGGEGGRRPGEEATRFMAPIKVHFSEVRPSDVEQHVWTQLCRVLLNLDETITRE